MSDSARDGWETCPPGEFARLSARLRTNHRRRDAFRGTVAVAVAVLMGSVLYQTWSRSWDYHYAGLSCSRVMTLVPGYAMGKLSPGRQKQVRQHVEKCPHCKPLFRMMGLVVHESHPWSKAPSIAPPVIQHS